MRKLGDDAPWQAKEVGDGVAEGLQQELRQEEDADGEAEVWQGEDDGVRRGGIEGRRLAENDAQGVHVFFSMVSMGDVAVDIRCFDCRSVSPSIVQSDVCVFLRG